MFSPLKSSLKYSGRFFSDQCRKKNHACKLLVVGGGAGGCTIANKFAGSMKKHETILIEPNEDHYYQPMYTLVGAGIKKLSNSKRKTWEFVPNDTLWIKDKVARFDPKNSEVVTENGSIIKYDLLLVATGLELHYEKIPGVSEALSNPKSGVCSNYSHRHVEKTYKCLQNFQKGNAIFTFPNTPIKCPGAPQKAAYLSDDYLRKNEKRKNARVIYNTTLPVVFGVKKYADALWKVVEKRDIDVNLRTNLISINPAKKIATFECLDEPGKNIELDYELLNVTPPMGAPYCVSSSKELVNSSGFVEVDELTLQSTKFPNVFAIGDCSSTPNAKTAAAVASQSAVVFKNMDAVFKGKEPSAVYNGYGSCPLLTARGKCILAEFDYKLNPLETLPFNQAQELYITYFMKKELMPHIYWMMLKGHWDGPKSLRKLLRLGFD